MALMKGHRALPLPNAFPVLLQKDNQCNGGERDSGLDTKDLCRTELPNPLELNIRRHEPSPVAASRDPRTDLPRAFGIAVEEVGVDGRCDDHDAEALHRRKDGENHVVPLVLECETEDE